MKQLINVFYRGPNCQFDDETLKDFRSKNYFHREFWFFERNLHLNGETPTYDTDDYEFNFVRNNETSKLINTETSFTLIPCDLQSYSLGREQLDKSYTVNEFGKKYGEIISDIANDDRIQNKVFLIYSSTEPFYFNATVYLSELAKKHKNCKFVISGSGMADTYYPWQLDVLAEANIVFISRMWYVDQVYQRTFLNVWGMRRAHMDIDAVDAPPHLDEYNRYKPKFVFTMKNIRLHRALAAYYFENDREILDTMVYARNFGLAPNAADPNIGEYKHQVYLTLNTLKEISRTEQIPENIKIRIIKHLFSNFPHHIDLKSSFEEKENAPPYWLYKGASMAIIAEGEWNGFGFADEKLVIPIAFKKPFISFGSQGGLHGTYEQMKAVGFNMYDDFFDVSYNRYETIHDRVHGCYKLVKKLVQMPLGDFYKLMEDMQPIVEQNYEHLATGNFLRVANKNFLKELCNVASSSWRKTDS